MFYALVIVAVGFVMGPQAIVDSEQATGLVTADAMAAAFNTKIMAKVIIVGGMCGIVTSWNSFMLGGSRAMYSMAESYMIPKFFAKLHPKHKTPINALILIGSLTMLAPFAGRKMLVWISDAGNFGCCVAYCMVALSFIILTQEEAGYAKTLQGSSIQVLWNNGGHHVRLHGCHVLHTGKRRITYRPGVGHRACMVCARRGILRLL